MIGLALLAGAILGLRFRIGLVLAATAAVFAFGLGLQIHEHSGAATALAGAAVGATITQVAAFLVYVLKAVVESGAEARA